MTQQNKNHMIPTACKIISVVKETDIEWTFRVESPFKANHGQFMQLSVPKIGEAPISISEIGDDYMDFTLRAVGKVTNEIFEKQAGDFLFLRGPYGNGWPVEELKDKHLVFITGGTGLAPVRSLLNEFYNNISSFKTVTFISGFKNKESILFKDELKNWQKFSAFVMNNKPEYLHGGHLIDRAGYKKFKEIMLDGVKLNPECLVAENVFWQETEYRSNFNVKKLNIV